jgi:hypothetical protein
MLTSTLWGSIGNQPVHYLAGLQYDAIGGILQGMHPTKMLGRTPRAIVAELDRHIIGQRWAKRIVAVAMHNHVQRLEFQRRQSEQRRDEAEHAARSELMSVMLTPQRRAPPCIATSPCPLHAAEDCLVMTVYHIVDTIHMFHHLRCLHLRHCRTGTVCRGQDDPESALVLGYAVKY